MSTRKSDEERKRLLAVTTNLGEWARVDIAASMLGVTPDAIQNNIYDKKYPELYIRQSIFSKVWWVWVPAIIGFTAEEWQNKMQ